MLASPNEVVWALLTYTDWWQPNTASVFQVAGRRHGYTSDGIREGMLATLTERDELCRRMQDLDERSRRVLYLWYLEQLPAIDIARRLGIGRRHCFRLRAQAVRRIVELGDPVVSSSGSI